MTKHLLWYAFWAMMIILLLVLGAVVVASATPLDRFAYEDLTVMSPAEQRAFMAGFIMGSYAAALLANRQYDLPREEAEELMLLEIWPADLLRQTLAWYARTGLLTMPLYVAVYRRDID